MNQGLHGLPGGGPPRRQALIQVKRSGSYKTSGAVGYTTPANGAATAWTQLVADTGLLPIMAWVNAFTHSTIIAEFAIGGAGSEQQVQGINLGGGLGAGAPIFQFPANSRISYRVFNPVGSGTGSGLGGSCTLNYAQMTKPAVLARCMGGLTNYSNNVVAGVAPTYGAWTEIVEANRVPYRFTMPSLADFAGVGGGIWQIGVGGAGAESVVATWTERSTANDSAGPGWKLLAESIGSNNNAPVLLAQLVQPLPVEQLIFPAGARVSMRWATTAGGHSSAAYASATCVEVL